MRNKRGKILVNIDWLCIVIVLIMMIMGWLNIYATVLDENHKSIFDFSQRYGKQLLWIIISIPIIFLVLIIDSKFYSTFAYIFYIIGILLLIAVLLFGIEVNATKAWFDFGTFRVQPAEFVKFMLSLAIAQQLSSKNFSFNKISAVVRLILIYTLPILLVLLQNDVGTALVFFSLILVLYREGLNNILFFTSFALIGLFIMALIVEPVPLLLSICFLICIFFFFLNNRSKNSKILILINVILSIIALFLTYQINITKYPSIIALSVVVIIALTMLFFYLKSMDKTIFIPFALLIGISFYVFTVDYAFDNFLKPHHQNRINEMLGKYHDPMGVGYNLNQSKIAIGSGGLTGKGFLQGTQTKFDFVPEQSTDFIFCTIGEEWGLAGTTTILLLFSILIIRLISLAERQRSSFSRIYGYCVASILFFHVAVNIGMTVGVVPIIGIPLPFFSYGGSSLWAFTILIFIFLKLDSDRLQVFRS